MMLQLTFAYYPVSSLKSKLVSELEGYPDPVGFLSFFFFFGKKGVNWNSNHSDGE